MIRLPRRQGQGPNHSSSTRQTVLAANLQSATKPTDVRHSSAAIVTRVEHQCTVTACWKAREFRGDTGNSSTVSC